MEEFEEDNIRKRLILDFSGVIIDVKEETKNFQGLYPYFLCNKLNLDIKKYIPKFNEIKENLKNNGNQGFFVEGQDVMPASCEPSTLTHLAGQEFMKSLNLQIENQNNLLIEIYDEITATVGEKKNFYREDKERTKQFLSKVSEKYEVCFITNSRREKVLEYFEELGTEYFNNMEIYTLAGKLSVKNDYKDLPKSMSLGATYSPREILLRRERYHKTLNFLEDEKGFYPSITTVVGSIYEMDLALPDYLNYKIIQIENGYSKEYERNYLGKRFVNNYNELEDLLFED
jgi:hypothetical protein